MEEVTDWDSYYRRTPSYTSLTRSISARKLVGLIKHHAPRSPADICEIGGANSCFVEKVCEEVPVGEYHVVDFNDYGLSLLANKSVSPSLTWERGDVLDKYTSERQYDIVYSVGLIEHFLPDNTRRAIDGHFARCKPGGTVLITFPTPTLPYRLIRGVAEATGRWSFPDERPLGFEEVLSSCLKHGDLLHRSINWMIGLTQGYVLFRKRA